MASTITDIEVFLVVVRRGSFSAAARELGTTRSAVSKAMGRLEDRLGVALLHRTTRSMSVTSAGARLAEGAREPLERLALLQDELVADTALRGRVRLAVPLAYGTRFVAPAIHRFLLAHPQAEVEASYEDRWLDLGEEGVDLAIRGGRLPDSTMLARRLRRIEVLLMCSPAYLAERGPIPSPEGLAVHRLLSNTRDPLVLTREGEQISVRPRLALVTRNGDARAQAARAGLGIAVLPDFMELDGLVRVLPSWSLWGHVQRAFYLLRPAGRRASRVVRALADHLAAELTPRADGAASP